MEWTETTGMSLRDTFALEVMRGMLDIHNRTYDQDFDPKLFAKACYLLADAMMEEREDEG